MKKRAFIAFLAVFIISCFIFVSCPVDSTDGGGGSGETKASLGDYQAAGANIAAKPYVVGVYMCANYSAQFYKACKELNYPCRIRLGTAGGSVVEEPEAHAWNSVKINGKWVDWEPQINNVYNGHKQDKTDIGLSPFYLEDIFRMIFEMIGRQVPNNVTDKFDLNKWHTNAPIYQYYLPVAYCLSDDPDLATWLIVNGIPSLVPNNNDGDVVPMSYNGVISLAWFFRYNNKIYGIEYLEQYDPTEGRSILKNYTFESAAAQGTGFKELSKDTVYQ